LQADSWEALRQKTMQFAAIHHSTKHQHHMLQFERQQELFMPSLCFYFNNELINIIPKNWTDNGGWQMAEAC